MEVYTRTVARYAVLMQRDVIAEHVYGISKRQTERMLTRKAAQLAEVEAELSALLTAVTADELTRLVMHKNPEGRMAAQIGAIWGSH